MYYRQKVFHECLTGFGRFVNLYTYLDIDMFMGKIISPPLVKPEGTLCLHSVRLLVCLSVLRFVFHIHFPGFILLCFHICGWKLVATSIWRVTDQVRLPSGSAYFFTLYLSHLYSRLLLTMLSHIWQYSQYACCQIIYITSNPILTVASSHVHLVKFSVLPC